MLIFWTILAFGDVEVVVSDPGLYAVDLDAYQLGPEKLGLYHLGQPVPFWVRSTEAGNQLIFRAALLSGQYGTYHEYASEDVFVLRAEDPSPPAVQLSAKPTHLTSSYQATYFWEKDQLLMRFGGDRDPHEVWYWHQLTCNDADPFEHTFTINPPQSTAPFRLEVEMRGWSTLPASLKTTFPAHVLQLHLNGQPLEVRSWSSSSKEIVQWTIPAELIFSDKPNQLSLKVPRRTDATDGLIVDVAILNWIRLTQTTDQIGAPQAFTLLPGSNWTFPPNPNPVLLWDEAGHFARLQNSERVEIDFPADSRVWIWPEGDLRKPLEIRALNLEPQEPRPLDLLVITHERLWSESQHLVALHRARGLNVGLFEIHDIYRRYNFGILDPKALRDFIADVYLNWPKPGPRYVLIVGDASWDSKNQEFRKENYADAHFQHPQNTSLGNIPSTLYQGPPLNNRNLVSTSIYFDSSGHSASDNYFVCVDGDDFVPDLAIGRLPFVEPHEVQAWVQKEKRYLENLGQIPPQKEILWITNESPGFQRVSDNFAHNLATKGYSSLKVYPYAAEKDNSQNLERIVSAMNQNPFLVSFYGHGGRFIWRTGPPDPVKNHDLFRIRDVDTLQPQTVPPVILSFTCFSAPFDHPGSDSIGEKFVRRADGGAIAFVGASWRNQPGVALQTAMVEAFTSDARTIGEAFLSAKKQINNRTWLETYNLLGNPALPLPPPALSFPVVRAQEGASGFVLLEPNLAIQSCAVSFLDEGGALLDQQNYHRSGNAFLPDDPANGSMSGSAQPTWKYASIHARDSEGQSYHAIIPNLVENPDSSPESTHPGRE
ncbi:MAG: hypothetical protein KDC71_14505 [Acidobacteria bacterium]|nr:hypothetical protein [Acidobacteriota bacterium]